MKNLRTVITALVMVLAASGWAYAQGPQKGNTQPGRQHMEKARQDMFKQLDLTAEQQKQLTENRQAEAKKMQQLRKTVREKQQALQQALNDPAVTREQVEPLVNEIKSLQAQTIDDRVEGIFTVKQILTPEQYAKFNQIMEEKKEKQQGGRIQRWKEKIENLGQKQEQEETAK